jgi:hypothetical protein
MSIQINFDHLQFYVDKVETLSHYKAIEEKLNNFASQAEARKLSYKNAPRDTTALRELWCSLGDAADPSQYQSHGQDIIEQLVYGFGWRVTAEHDGVDTYSLLLSTDDMLGAKFVVTGPKNDSKSDEASDPATKKTKKENEFSHFQLSNVTRFKDYHRGAQGMAVLAFALPEKASFDSVVSKYQEKHPKLITEPPKTYTVDNGGSVHVFDVFAYYLKGEADTGTVVRYIARSDGVSSALPLPGLTQVAATFDGSGCPAYSDHWVSNVLDREEFLDTLNDTLGFTPKVDFNAGVVAAGEAQIESTVTGNTSSMTTTDPAVALADQGQVFLPINNALSPVGHVHWYLEEIGQGIQHAASRVESLPVYVQRANDFRAITGEGFTFLKIPRTYYGLLDVDFLVDNAGVSKDEATKIISDITAAGLCDDVGAVCQSVYEPEGSAKLSQVLSGVTNQEKVQAAVVASIYRNLKLLLKDTISEEMYLTIVRNQILIDMQGEDVLMQIFTSCVMQRKAGTEAPFLEFIQRLCAVPKDGAGSAAIRAGCGGFGIRNFLTLFLSIEVSKAMADAKAATTEEDAAFHGHRVELFTNQLVESNPILNEISECMTIEGDALASGDTAAATAASARKELANQALHACSTKYNNLMKAHRENKAVASK